MTKREPERLLSVSAAPAPTPEPVPGPAPAAAKGLSAHILPTSATMIGVCMTVLSIGHLRPGGDLRMVLDKLLAVDALVFLASALLSFISMRTSRSGHRLEARAEFVFITGLGLLALGAVLLAFAIT